MGLDAVELVMEVEDEFGIHISDAEAQSVLTVQDLARLAFSTREQRRAASCPSASSFYALRSAWVRAGVAERGEITPGASVSKLVTTLKRREAWRSASLAGVHLPALWTPSVVSFLAIAIAAVGAAIVMLIAMLASTPSFLTWLMLPAGLAIALDSSVRTAVPPGVVTIRELIHASQPGAGRSTVDQYAAVLFRVREITAEQLGLPLSRVQPDSRFIEDLHID